MGLTTPPPRSLHYFPEKEGRWVLEVGGGGGGGGDTIKRAAEAAPPGGSGGEEAGEGEKEVEVRMAHFLHNHSEKQKKASRKNRTKCNAITMDYLDGRTHNVVQYASEKSPPI